jgi:hypothetical protein
MQQQQQQQQGAGSGSQLPLRAAAAAAEPAGPAGSSSSSSEVPLLARELGVSVGSLMRLFRADAEAEFEQPVWMVVNLQVIVCCLFTYNQGVIVMYDIVVYDMYMHMVLPCVGTRVATWRVHQRRLFRADAGAACRQGAALAVWQLPCSCTIKLWGVGPVQG